MLQVKAYIPEINVALNGQRNTNSVVFELILPSNLTQTTWCLVSVCAFDFWDAHAYPASHPVTSRLNEKDANRQANTHFLLE